MSLRTSALLPVTSAALALAALTLGGSARADEPVPAFGGAGTVVLSDLIGIRSSGLGYLGSLSPIGGGPGISGLVGYAHDEQVSGSFAAPQVTSVADAFAVNPSADVFLSKRVTVGASVGYTHWEETDSYVATQFQDASVTRWRSTLLAVAPRVGYVVPLGHGVSLWPRLGVGYTASWVSQQITQGASDFRAQALAGRWTGGVDLGVVYRPTTHLYFSAAPELAVSASWLDTQQSPGYVARSEGVRVRLAATLAMGVIL